MKKKLIKIGIVGAGLGLIGACDQDAYQTAEATSAGGEVELTCPLPAPQSTDPGPLPVADPMRAQQLPDLGDCALPARAMPRLTRTEYNNTVQDLFGIDISPADSFPADDAQNGFDNQADALTIPPVLLEHYATAAREVTGAALDTGAPKPALVIYEAEELWGKRNGGDTVHYVQTNSKRVLNTSVSIAGAYDYSVRAFGEQAGLDPVRIQLVVDGESLGYFDVESTSEAPEMITHRLELAAGEHTFEVHYVNEYNRPEDFDRAPEDRNLVIDSLELNGPFGAPAPDEVPAARAALLTCSPDDMGGGNAGALACASEILRDVTYRAYRRPVTDYEVDQLVGLVQFGLNDDLPFEDSLKLALRAVLMSPHFLFRIERDPDPADPNPQLLDSYAMASRLSYFLWASGPDARLLELAERDALRDPAVVESEVYRMLDDEKAGALVQSFAGQWLQTQAVDGLLLDPELFPDVDKTLRRSMRCETELVVSDLIRNGGTVKDLVLADFTYVNGPLASHYDLDDPAAEPVGAHPESGFAKVSLEGTARTGVLTHAGILALGAHPDRTSPVLRGKWVLERLMCTPPPPPPPGVEGLIPPTADAQTVRERLAVHRENPACAACHDLMDPIGLALENFDASGAYRTHDNGVEIDASGLFMQTDHFDGAQELAQLLAEESQLQTCAIEKTLTYALGRAVGADDACTLATLESALADRDYQLKDLFVLVATSAPFRMRAAPTTVVQVEDDVELYGEDQ